MLIDNPESPVAVGLSEDSTHFVSFRAATSHNFLHERGLAFHIILDTRFEMVGGQAELPSKSPKLIPCPEELSGFHDPEAAEHHLVRVEAGGQLAVSSLTNPSVAPGSSTGGFVNSPRKVRRSADTGWGK